MDIKYTEAQAIALNALADAAKKVRDEAAYAMSAASNIAFQLDKNYRLSEGFGKNKLSEAVVQYNTVADIAGAVCLSLRGFEIEESFAIANRVGQGPSRFKASN